MNQKNLCVEDCLEYLGGLKRNITNIQIDNHEQIVIKSLAEQVYKDIALTDRQLNLVLKKIEKYKNDLEANLIDVDDILLTKRLRKPIRYIDRSQYAKIDRENNESVIKIRYPFSKRLESKWHSISQSIKGQVKHDKTNSMKTVLLLEHNVLLLVDSFLDRDFTIDSKLLEIYEKINEIKNNPDQYLSCIDFVDGKIVLKNLNDKCLSYLDEKITDLDQNFPSSISTIKGCGVLNLSERLLDEIDHRNYTDLTKEVLKNPKTRLKIDPKKHEFSQLLTTIENLNQWPVLIMIDENPSIPSLVKFINENLKNYIPTDKFTVFFRLGADEKDFNQYIKDQNLNNYIDADTKAVVILKNKIPKPLLKSEWKPRTAIVMSTNTYGRSNAYINQFENVYYYNEWYDEINHMRIDRILNV